MEWSKEQTLQGNLLDETNHVHRFHKLDINI